MSQGTGKPPPCAALLAVACAAQESDGDGAGKGTSVIFLPLSSSGIAKAGSPITMARVAACLAGNHRPTLPRFTPVLL